MTTVQTHRPAGVVPSVTPSAQTTQHAALNRVLAVTRVATGFIFLWAFLDKTFGLGYSTSTANAWINGGSPTSGFLGHVEVGPFHEFFQNLAGIGALDWLFMIGMLGIGVAVIAGIGLRISAGIGTVILVLMWAAEWPLATTTVTGDPSGSTNPFVDYHLIYALVLIVLAVAAAGRTWGLGRIWESTSLVKRLPWLK